MTFSCRHHADEYFTNFWDLGPQRPTAEEINRDRLWECSHCHRWYSLIGRIKLRRTL